MAGLKLVHPCEGNFGLLEAVALFINLLRKLKTGLQVALKPCYVMLRCSGILKQRTAVIVFISVG